QADVWHDFHESVMPEIREALAAQMGPQYVVKIDEHIYIHELATGERNLLGRADVGVAHPTSLEGPGGASTVAAPVMIWLPEVDVERQSFVEIRDRRNR